MGLLGSLHRVIDRYVSLEKTLDDWKHLSTDVWEGLDEDLIVAIAKQDEGFAKYDKEYTDVTRKYEKAIDRCKIISNKASQAQNVTETAPPSTNENRPNGVKTQGMFRPLADLKPVFLNKDCNLIEFLEFTKAIIWYNNTTRCCVFSPKSTCGCLVATLYRVCGAYNQLRHISFPKNDGHSCQG